ncbi:MAG TPA: hypothetical protein VGO51_00435, partial [Burkholderiaceae bacterium]|nr:hypothetical protein [Burkholderiaceae bacterium]
MPLPLVSAQKIDSNSASTRQALKQHRGRQAGDDDGLRQLEQSEAGLAIPASCFPNAAGKHAARVPVILKSQPCRDPRSAGKRR